MYKILALLTLVWPSQENVAATYLLQGEYKTYEECLKQKFLTEDVLSYSLRDFPGLHIDLACKKQ